MNSTSGAQAAKDGHQDWIPLIETATREVFELMLSSKLSPAPPDGTAVGEITAMVGLAGQLCGVLSVRCGSQAAILMASKMLGVEPDQVGADMPDAIGEVSNMVAGNFKNKISGLSEGCMLSPPTVVTGDDYSLHAPHAETPSLAVSFLFESMPIMVTLQIQT